MTGPLTRLRKLWQRRRAAREMDDEMRFHLAMAIDAHLDAGCSPGEARRLALRDLGGVEPTKETMRDVRALPVEGLWRDIVAAMRALRASPATTALMVFTLALGIGVNTAAFAVVYDVLIRPLPYRDPSRLVLLNLQFEQGGDLGFSPQALQDWLPRLLTLERAAGYVRREITVRAGAQSTVVPAVLVTEQFFDVLGTPAEVGEAVARQSAPDVIIGRRQAASIGLGEIDAVGRVVGVSDQPRTVTGIMPSEFAFPTDDIALWLPSSALIPGTRPETGGYSRIVARLRPGVTVEQARQDAERVRLAVNPKSRERVTVEPFGRSVLDPLRRVLLVALTGAVLVLLVACANVATWWIGRDRARQREQVTRMALGAAPSQLARRAVVETALLAILAACVGMALGAAALKVFVTQATGTIAGLHRVHLGVPVVLASGALLLVVTMLCGSIPIWRAARVEISSLWGSTAVARPRLWRLRAGLAIAQLAGVCVLLLGAGLLARTVQVVMKGDHGFDPQGALVAKVVLSDTVLFDGAGRERFVADLLMGVRRIPGVIHAGFGTMLPPRSSPITMSMRVVEGDRDETRFMKVGSATPGYLRAMGARFLSGRDFEDRDSRPDAAVVILSEGAARFFFPNDTAVGRTLARLPPIFGLSAPPEVIGVVADVKYDGLDAPASTALYLPWARRPMGSGYLMARKSLNPGALVTDVRNAAYALDSTVPLPEAQPVGEILAQSMAVRRVRALPAVGFGMLAIAVAFVGMVATVSTLVAERWRDLGIRAALGASPARLTWTIVRHGLGLIAAGLTLGLALGSAAARGLSSLLYGISPYDPMTFAGTIVLVGGGATLLTYVAGRRAGLVDPMRILRHE